MTTETRSALRAVRRLGLWWVVGVIAGAGLLVVGLGQVRPGVTFWPRPVLSGGCCGRSALWGGPVGWQFVGARSTSSAGSVWVPLWRSPSPSFASDSSGSTGRGIRCPARRSVGTRAGQRASPRTCCTNRSTRRFRLAHVRALRPSSDRRCGSDMRSWMARARAGASPAGTTDAVEPATT